MKLKKLLKKAVMSLMAIGTAFTSTSSFLPTKAATSVSLGTQINYSYNVTDSDGWTAYGSYMNYIYADGEIAFCVQPRVLVTNGASYSKSSYSDTQKKQIEYIAYVGWYLSDKTAEDYITTQLYIWEILGTTINSTSY